MNEPRPLSRTPAQSLTLLALFVSRRISRGISLGKQQGASAVQQDSVPSTALGGGSLLRRTERIRARNVIFVQREDGSTKLKTRWCWREVPAVPKSHIQLTTLPHPVYCSLHTRGTLCLANETRKMTLHAKVQHVQVGYTVHSYIRVGVCRQEVQQGQLAAI